MGNWLGLAALMAVQAPAFAQDAPAPPPQQQEVPQAAAPPADPDTSFGTDYDFSRPLPDCSTLPETGAHPQDAAHCAREDKLKELCAKPEMELSFGDAVTCRHWRARRPQNPASGAAGAAGQGESQG